MMYIIVPTYVYSYYKINNLRYMYRATNYKFVKHFYEPILSYVKNLVESLKMFILSQVHFIGVGMYILY